ncbi:hypothetical protein N7501_008951 [Penicillium viridicatum]|nr:hypothetical protein N7501_008951 [Penicillium viridicatum]
MQKLGRTGPRYWVFWGPSHWVWVGPGFWVETFDPKWVVRKPRSLLWRPETAAFPPVTLDGEPLDRPPP